MSGLMWAAVLALYPRRFRAEWGAELRQVAEEAVVEMRARGRGAAALAMCWFLWDALVSLPGVWREARARRVSSGGSRDPREPRTPAGAVGGAVDMLWQDVRYTLGMWRRSPKFTAFAVMTLALGMGAMIAIFSVMRGVLLRPMPYASPEGLVMISTTRAPLTNAAWDEIVAAQTLEDVTRWQGWRAGFVEADGTVGVRHSASVGADYFELLGTRAHLGRLFTSADEHGEVSDGVVLAWGAWQADFGGRADIIGHRFQVDDRHYTVIGVTPRSFMDPLGFPVNDIETSMYRLWQEPPLERRAADQPLGHLIVARLSAGVTVERAVDEVRVIAQRTHPRPDNHPEPRVATVESLHLDEVKPTLFLLTGAVSLLLLIGCVNAANLLLSRATVRHSELAVRGALGAARARLIGQLLTESLMLALVAGVVGTWLGHAGARAIVGFAGDAIPRGDAVRLDGVVVAFTFGLACVTAVLFGIAPALQWSRAAAADALRSNARGAAGAASGKRLRNVLVVAETALAVMLTFGAALLSTSLWKLQHVDPGYDAENVLTVRATLPPQRFDPERRIRAQDQMVDAIGRVPGVISAASITYHPLSGGSVKVPVGRGGEELDARTAPRTDVRSITPAYFETMGMRLVAGRAHTAADRAGSEPVAVVNETLARQLFPDSDPLGRSVNLGGSEFRIIGVAADVKEFSLAQEGLPFMWITFDQSPPNTLPATSTLVIRTSVGVAEVVQPVRAAIREIDPTIPVAFIRTMREMMDIDLLAPRLRTLLIGSIGVLAALLAAFGLAGVMAYTVAQTIPEIGVRMALGARERDVARLVLGQALGLTALGIALGVAGALAAGRLLAGMLFSVQANDPLVLAAVAAATVVLALAASGVPALRAVRVSPAHVLRGL